MTLLQQFLNLFKDQRKRLKMAVQITQWLKKAVDSDTADLIIDIIPGDKDAKFRDNASRRLAEVLKYLNLMGNITFINRYGILSLKGKDRALYFKAIAAELAHRDLGIDYDSAEAQTQLIYHTDPTFQEFKRV